MTTLTEQHSTEIAALRSAAPTTSAAVLDLLRRYDPMPASLYSGDAFYSAEDSDLDPLLSILLDYGWRLTWYEAHYHWQARHPHTGDTIRYVEGDVYPTPAQPL